MNVEFEARAFRIWQFCQSREWTCTMRDVAENLDLTVGQVRSVIASKMWGGRLPTEARGGLCEFKIAPHQGANISVARHVIRELVGERRELAE